MSYLLSNRPKLSRATINIVPLIDVLVVLIFFFLMTMQFKDLQVFKITPPKMESATDSSPASPSSIHIGILPKGIFIVNNANVSENDLPNTLSSLAKKLTNPSVLILADENTELKYMSKAVDEAKKAGLLSIHLKIRHH